MELALYIVLYNKSGLKSPHLLRKEFHDKNEHLIHNITVHWKYPIYGYSRDKKPFLKIEMYEPRHIKKCAHLLYSGVIFGSSI